ncbi:unnamed protein product [Caenorhabditis nigoni]
MAFLDSEPITSVNGKGPREKEIYCQEKSQNCPPGPPGPQGKAGRDGEPGEPGIDGTNGSSGISVVVAGGCIKCPAGKPGKRGKKGEMSRKGKNGKKGKSVKAVIGAIGSMGVPGYPGFPGPPGPRPPGRISNRYINPVHLVHQEGKDIKGRRDRQALFTTLALSVLLDFPTGQKGRPGWDGNYCECPAPRIPRRYI